MPKKIFSQKKRNAQTKEYGTSVIDRKVHK